MAAPVVRADGFLDREAAEQVVPERRLNAQLPWSPFVPAGRAHTVQQVLEHPRMYKSQLNHKVMAA
ncbi:hypothetical protein GCM10029978_088370 [Actinoallomurus acanthiterrae]